VAKRRRAETSSGYQNLQEVLTLETASMLTDYMRQYIGIAQANTPQPGSGIFINFDRVLRTQMYQELAWYELYDEVERDPHVSAVMRTLKLTVASREWDIVAADDSGRAAAIADFVRETLRGMEDFTQDLYELLDAEGKGFSVSEVIWDVGYETRIKRLMHRPQRRFQFDASTRAPRLRTTADPYMGEVLPERKFIIHRVSAKYENPFGDALDQSLYWMWLFKHTILKFWMTHLDVASAPVPFVKIPANSKDEVKTEADELAAKIRRGAAGRLPSNFDIIWAEANNSAQTAASYEKFVDSCNAEMTKCVLGQTLTTEGSSKSGSGSRALGEVHGDTLAMRTQFSSRALEATLNGTLIRWLVDANYSGVDGYPKFQFLTSKVEDRKSEALIVKTLSDAGYKVTCEWVEEKFQVELEEKVEPPPQLVPPALATGATDEEADPEAGSETDEGEETDPAEDPKDMKKKEESK
jgi:phage gp29-like protein